MAALEHYPSLLCYPPFAIQKGMVGYMWCKLVDQTHHRVILTTAGSPDVTPGPAGTARFRSSERGCAAAPAHRPITDARPRRRCRSPPGYPVRPRPGTAVPC
eukprot:362798-Hanusia_phi.AAC.1